MGEENYSRKWDELIPDALNLIFKNLSLVELLTVVPRVCKSWGKTVAQPYCWQEIDLEQWSRNRRPEIIDRMLLLLISRSDGSPRKLSVSGLTNDESILFIANHAQSLHTLCLPKCNMTNSMAEKISGKLSSLTSLDLSYCCSLGAPALESIGKSCRSLTTLKRAMHPFEVNSIVSQVDEAWAIAFTMPKLEHLEMSYMKVTTSSVVEILESCKRLRMLVIHGCWGVALEDSVLERFAEVRVVQSDMVGWDVVGRRDFSDWDDDDDDSDLDVHDGDLPWYEYDWHWSP